MEAHTHHDGIIKKTIISLKEFLETFLKNTKLKMGLKPSIRGNYKFVECDCSSVEAKEFSEKISKSIKNGEKNVREMIREFHSLFAIRKWEKKNIVPNVGLNILSYALSPIPVEAGKDPRITYAAVGTGTTTPALEDTTLETEVFRTTISSQSNNANVAYNTLFLGYSDANGYDLSEMGLFCGDASATADSGKLFSHVLVSPVFAKTDAKTLTIDVSHTFSNS